MRSYALKPWQLSLVTHAVLAGAFLGMTMIRIPTKEYIEVPVEVEMPKEVQNITKLPEKPEVVLKSVNEPEPRATSKPARQVFGASRDSYTDETGGEVEAKKGNTLAKAADTQVLTDEDPSSLPTPTEEYLVSEMPVVISEVKPVYPKEARTERIEGTVDLDVLVDKQGVVRQVNVIEGPEIFRVGALQAMKKFKFKPAQVDGKPVAVRIRYSLEFKLEY